MTPEELLTEAHKLIVRPDASTVGVWPRAAAFLARQAIEIAVDERWSEDPATEPMRHATMWSKLACLPAYLDKQVARQVTFAYASLSSACHYHHYELAPTAAELTSWITDVEALVTQLRQVEVAP